VPSSERLRPIRQAIDWGELGPLRLRARLVAEGVFAGLHRSARRGAGVEFGGFREYVAGDDLRWLDRRSLQRHERLVVRQFETETDRDLCLLVDASASMGFRGPGAPGAKLAYAAVVAAALARIALAEGDPVSVTLLGGGAHARSVPRSGGREQFERIVATLESADAGGDAHVDVGLLDRALQALSRGARRGAIVVVLSDLIDLPPGAAERIAAVGTGDRVLAVTQVLDPAEAKFPYGGHVRLRALEGGVVVETDADTAREQYLAAMAELTREWREEVVRHGARFLAVTSGDDAVRTVRSIVESVR
jgi:uncharacterized protein (DUF58 family)